MSRKLIPPDSVVDTAIRRFRHTVPRRVLAHTRHCFTVLRYNLRCLTNGLQVLSTTLLPSLSKHPAAVQHIFTQMLRLHDGYILCVSGECRHAGDAQTNPKYPSRLAEHEGVYHASRTYSGTGWDEWNDPVVGLRTQGEFEDDELWDLTVVEATEQQMQTWQSDFRRAKDQLKGKLTTLFYPATVSILWNDKMEQVRCVRSVLMNEELD